MHALSLRLIEELEAVRQAELEKSQQEELKAAANKALT